MGTANHMKKRKGVRHKKIETRRKIVGVPKSLSGFARRFTEGIEKLTGNTLGDHQGEDQKTYRKFLEVTGLAKVRS
ncbi:hypothetical protein BHE74_00016457 [Ensete ventricosum]|nr:hypothetical protein BHE74_00016457 [Ensete ventricosum]